ncbi:MAG: 30S ribosomal protein S6 [Acidimicrobiales bacterium]|jgi:small subunit ribosomal protein S6|nr:30S ribosomal protein S6 [Acidimicrobiaceae bacterium]MBT5567869.1 30S ribosomal protein S6 [Acidimicrobiaceae bacterium]MDG2160317.1 30S ribosomal protein S6 [Acidimicrobiales bacterium]|tara:strand:+ start:573 stop:941 length:369 start_codon:yes stop_codon:yes gene_type:complete
MQVYELMIIFGGELEEDAVAASLSKVTTNIESEGGRVVTVRDSAPWGRRRFAYRINLKWEGVYVVLEVVTDAGNLDTTDRILRLADRSDVVRHKIMRLPDAEVAKRGLLGEVAPAEAGSGTE